MRNGTPLYIRSSRRVARRTGISRIATAVFVVLLIAVNYMVFFREEGGPPAPPPASEEGVQPVTPAAPEATPPEARPSGAPESLPSQVFAGELRAGDRMLDALERLGLDRQEARHAVRAMERVFDFRLARAGDGFQVKVDAAGRIEEFEYRRSAVEVYRVAREGDRLLSEKRDIPTEVQQAALGCVLRGKHHESLTTCLKDPALATRVRELLDRTMDVAAETRAGDELRVVVERLVADGQFLRFGRILALDYRGKLASAALYAFPSKEGEDLYYHADGGSVERTFLRSPLRMNGDLADTAVRPVLHPYRRHMGLDYPVDKGTPVVATASGTVTFAGPKGSSGTLVSVRHGREATTYYAHLSRIASDLRKGTKVVQGQLLGYSGDSGKTSGPRLHYALKAGGSFVNPLQHVAASLRTLAGEERDAFAKVVEELNRALEATTLVDPTDSES